MILIEEDKLIHTDSSEDILLHFGTKGMKWGVRKAALKKLKENYKKNNSATGLLERQVRNLEKNKAAKAQYKKEKANATTKMEKSKAKTKYKRAINPLSY